MKLKFLGRVIAGGILASGFVSAAFAITFNIPAGDLNAALSDYSAKTGVQLIVAADAVKGVRTKGAVGEFAPDDALMHILAGTGFIARHKMGAAIIMRGN
ncbi:MAG TPA: STN domain-containing protein, partial [Rhizomicrobium sp.]|nr:STN domain-containing protein [Rhizomicrobium sp.]